MKWMHPTPGQIWIHLGDSIFSTANNCTIYTFFYIFFLHYGPPYFKIYFGKSQNLKIKKLFEINLSSLKFEQKKKDFFWTTVIKNHIRVNTVTSFDWIKRKNV